MKHKKELSLSIACFLLSFLCFMAWNQERDENLAAKICPAVLRLHVIGASNSDQDPAGKIAGKKLCGKTDLQLECQLQGRAGARGPEPSDQSGRRHPLLRRVGAWYSPGCKAVGKPDLFPTKSYGDLTFPQGMYDAVEIRLGAGRGRNWWCVLYPELCFPDLTHAVVPEESKEKLTELLGKETYAQLLKSQNARLNIQPGILKLLKSLL